VRAAIVALALALGLTPAPAHADDPPRLVLVPSGVDGALVERLRAELAAMGFAVSVAGPAHPIARDALEDAARAGAAVAAVGITPARAGIELWIVDRVTGKTLLRDVAEAGADRDTTVALRAVELLRASLLELDAPHPSRGETPAPAEIRAIAGLPAPAPPAPPPVSTSPPASASPPASLRPLFALGIAPAIVGSPGGLAPFPALDVGVRAWLHPRVAAGIFGLVPLATLPTSGPEGSSETRIALVATDVRVSLAPRGARWVPTAGAGVALVWLHTAGSASPGYVDLSNDGLTAAPFLRPGLGFSLSERLRLRADGLAGVTLRRLAVDYAGRVVARWGDPLLAASLGVEVDLP
jgi:hypothetical protein